MKRSGPITRKTPMPRPSTPMARSALLRSSTPVKARNPKRHAANTARAYDSPARRTWVTTLPCVGCGIEGFSQNAHVCGNDGGSRKGNAKTIAPLCHDRPGVEGCHTKYDRHRAPFDTDAARDAVMRAAEETESAWQRHLGEAA